MSEILPVEEIGIVYGIVLNVIGKMMTISRVPPDGSIDYITVLVQNETDVVVPPAENAAVNLE